VLTVDDLKSAPPAGHPEEVLACHRLVVRVRQATASPLAIALESVEASSPYVLVHRTPDGVFPLSLAPRALEPPVPAPAPAPAVAFSLHADRLEVDDGRVDFLDTTLAPPYWRSLAQLALHADDLALPAARVARFTGGGMIDEISPAKIAGTVGDPTRLTVDVKQLALPPLNPYVTPVSAYEVSSGALTMHSEIVLRRSQLDATNRLVLSRLGVAGGGEGGDFLTQQLGIPLTLALALMKDYRGNIALDVPVRGDVGSPSFSLASLLLQAAVRAVKGAILSPLNALGRLVLDRGGKIQRVDIDPIPFPPGSATPDAATLRRVAQVGRVLAEHPELHVTAQGRVSRADVPAVQTGQALASVDLARTPERLAAYLRARRDGRTPPPLTDQEREELARLEERLPWPETELESLARARAEAARAAVSRRHGVQEDQVRETPPPPATRENLADQPSVTVRLGG
jgi:hypothetical protein